MRGELAGVVASTQGSADEWEDCLDTNVTSVLLATKYAEPHLAASAAAKRRTAAIFIGSCYGVLPMPAAAPYAASKWALQGFSSSLFGAWKKQGIKVSVINPGHTLTPLAVAVNVGEKHDDYIHASAIADAVYFVASFHESGCPTQIDVFPQYKE